MKGLLTKDFLTIQKKYGMKRLVMDIAIIIAPVSYTHLTLPTNREV